ncbi:MAG: TA0956 family protein [Thermoplasmatales archaeon]
MRCFLFMIGFTQSDRSNICVVEENVKAAVEEFINVDPSDRWTVEDLISKFGRKEAITKDDQTVGYILISIPEKTVEMSLSYDDGKGLVESLREIAGKQGYKLVT